MKVHRSNLYAYLNNLKYDPETGDIHSDPTKEGIDIVFHMTSVDLDGVDKGKEYNKASKRGKTINMSPSEHLDGITKKVPGTSRVHGIRENEDGSIFSYNSDNEKITFNSIDDYSKYEESDLPYVRMEFFELGEGEAHFNISVDDFVGINAGKSQESTRTLRRIASHELGHAEGYFLNIKNYIFYQFFPGEDKGHEKHEKNGQNAEERENTDRPQSIFSIIFCDFYKFICSRLLFEF